MAEIAARPRNGYRMLSTFSGCGGSCLGFEMEGFTVVAASEFIAVAADTYRRNHPGVPVDTRDIREVDADAWLDQLGLLPGDLDVLEGSPPCASFSGAGVRGGGITARWGQVHKYSDTKQRTDDLFFEFARIRDAMRPKVFVAENVSGLIAGASQGYFKDILRRLRQGYRVEARVLDAQWLGVPQARKRIIFVGVRDDLDGHPAFPDPLPYRYSIDDALPNLRDHQPTTHDPETGERIMLSGQATRVYDSVRPGQNVEGTKWFAIRRTGYGKPSPTILATPTSRPCHPAEPRRFTLGELRALGSFPSDFELVGTYVQRGERIGRAVPPLMMAAVARVIRDSILPSCGGGGA